MNSIEQSNATIDRCNMVLYTTKAIYDMIKYFMNNHIHPPIHDMIKYTANINPLHETMSSTQSK